MYYPAAVKSVNLNTPHLLSEGTEERAVCTESISWQTAEKVSRGLRQRCATCSVAADRDGGTQDTGWRWVSWTPGATVGDDAGTEGQCMGMLHMEVHIHLRQRPARPFFFLSLTLKYMKKNYISGSVRHLHTNRHRHNTDKCVCTGTNPL